MLPEAKIMTISKETESLDAPWGMNTGIRKSFT
jgi:hypothetical protein